MFLKFYRKLFLKSDQRNMWDFQVCKKVFSYSKIKNLYSMIRIGIVGCGAISERAHFPSVIKNPSFKLTAIVDVNRNKLGALKNGYSIAYASSDINSILEHVDALILATPPHIRSALAVTAVEAGKHIFCEKPFANTFVEAKLIAESSKQHKMVVGVAHTFRFAENRKYVRSLLKEIISKEEIIIKIIQASPASWKPETGYSYKKELVPGGVVLIEGLHTLDFLTWVFGKATIQKYIDDSLGGIESNAYMDLSFGENIQASVRMSRTSTLGKYIHVKSESYDIKMDLMNFHEIMINDKKIKLNNSKDADPFGKMCYDQLDNFSKAIQGIEPIVCSADEACELTALIENLYAIKKAKKIPVEAPITGFMY
ncbi:MAG: Gfo/Idh/MocA family oxidoreductase [Ginsengibacter sp.]